MIEHNLDIIKTTDLGPKGGVKGCEIVVGCVPEEVARGKESITGKFLKPLLNVRKVAGGDRMKTELRVDEPCGCGSKVAYGVCCKNTRVAYNRDGRGTIFKSIAIDKKGVAAVNEARKRFKEIFGRYPGKNDRLLADTYSYSPHDFQQDALEAFSKAGVAKEIAYAYRETGLIITKENSVLAAPNDIAEWDEAVERYFEASD